MIRITLDDTYLDLTDMTLRWESVNSLFEDDALQGDYSFPSTLKFSDVNMKALGFAHKADVPTESVVFDIILFLDERSIKSKLLINGTNRNGFNINIAGGVAGLLNSDKSLKDLPYFVESSGDGTIDLHSTFANMALYQFVDWRLAIAFPVHYNPEFYGSANPTFQGVVNRMDATIGNFKTNTPALGNKYCLVPFLYIHYILKTIADENGMTLTGTYAIDPEISTALLYNNYALDKKEEQGCFVKSNPDQIFIFEAQFYDMPGGYAAWPEETRLIILKDTLPDCTDSANNWNSAAVNKYSIPTTGDYAVRFKVTISMILATYTVGGAGFTFDDNAAKIQIIYESPSAVITVIGNQLYDIWTGGGPGEVDFEILATVSGALAGGKIYARLLNMDTFGNPITVFDGDPISVSYTIKDGAEMTISRYDGVEYNQMDSIVVLKNHVPDITVKEFLRLIKNWAQVEITPDWENRHLILNFAETTIKNSHEVDLTDLADPNYEQIFDEKNIGFTLSYDFGSSDGLLAGNFLPVNIDRIIGEFIQEVNLPAAAFIGDMAIVKNTNKVFRVEVVASVFTWVEYCDYYYPITVGKAGKERKVELAPMMMTGTQKNESATSDPDDIICIVPAISETGSSALFELGINEPSLRTVFMRGKLVPGTYGGKYIYGSSTNYDVNGHQTGNYTLKMQGADGWYARWLEKILLAIDNSAVFEYLIMLPTSYLRYKGKVQIKNVNFIIKNISMITGRFLKQSVVKLLKL